MNRRNILKALLGGAIAATASLNPAEALRLSRREIAALERRHRRLCRSTPRHDDCAIFRKDRP